MDGESSDEDGEEDISMSEEPGLDSGCTAVVALLRGELAMKILISMSYFEIMHFCLVGLVYNRLNVVKDCNTTCNLATDIGDLHYFIYLSAK